MNLENIRELRTVRGEEAVNSLLLTGKWRVLNLERRGNNGAGEAVSRIA